MPSLKVGNLGLSSLVKGDGTKTQEELDVEQQVLKDKQPILHKQATEPSPSPLGLKNVQHNRFMSDAPVNDPYKVPK